MSPDSISTPKSLQALSPIFSARVPTAPIASAYLGKWPSPATRTRSFEFKAGLAAILCWGCIAAAHAATFTCDPTPGIKSVAAGSSWIGGVAPNLAGGDTLKCAIPTVTIVIDTEAGIGNSPAAGTNVIAFTAGATLAIGHNVNLTAFGGIQASILQVAAGSHIRFDSSIAAAPLATPYTLTANKFTDDALYPPLNTPGNIWTIDYNPAGTTFRWAVTTAGSGVTGLHNFNWKGCGPSDNSTQCLAYAGGGSGVVAIGPGTFDTTCGIKWVGVVGVNDGVNLTGVTFKNTYPACAPIFYDPNNGPSPAAGVIRSMTGMIFDAPPTLQFPGGTVSAVMAGGMNAGVHLARMQGTMTHSFLRTVATPTEIGRFNWDNSTIIQDGTMSYSGGRLNTTPFRSGTVTSCTPNTARDSSASFPPTMVDDGSSAASGYVWVMLDGAAAGNVLNIRTATPTTATFFEYFTSLCSAGDHYAVYQAEANPHFMTVNPNTGNWVGTHLIGWFSGADPNGDFIHQAGQQGTTYTMSYVTTLTTVGVNHNISGTATTLGGSLTSTPKYDVSHFTYAVGTQSASVCEACHTASNATPAGVAGSVLRWQSSIAWANPSTVYPGVAATQQSIGPYKLETSSGLPSVYVSDIIATNCNFGSGPESCANFNFGYGTVAGGSATAAPSGYSYVLHGGNKAYNINSTVPMGTHDVDGIDPGFTNRNATLISWGKSLGIDVNEADPYKVLPDIMNCMMSANDPGGYTPAVCSPDAFYAYIGTAFAPHNVAYHNTAADGTDVGAWPYAAPPVTPVSIAVLPSAFILPAGGAQPLTCLTLLSDNTSRACLNPVFTSTNTASATVSGALVSATATAGNGFILVAAEGFGQAVSFTVTPPPAPVSIALSPATITLITGSTQIMTCLVTLTDNTMRPCMNPIYSSTNAASANVTGALVTATGTPGDGMILVAAEGLTQTAGFTVNLPPAPVSIALIPANINLLTGATQTLTCTTTLSDNTTRACINPVLSSGDLTHATVAGLTVSATSLPGLGTITVAAESLTAMAAFTVTAPPPTPVSISISPNPINLLAGATQTTTCTTSMSDKTTRACINPSLTSSDPTLATVAGLVVTATSLTGTGTITATAESLSSAPVTFTVTMYPSTSVACSAISLGPNGALNGFIPSPNDAWHQDITASPIDLNSATIISGATDLGGAYLSAAFSSLAAGNLGVPYTVVDSQTTAATPVPITLNPTQSDVAAIPLPSTLPVEGTPGECPTDTNPRRAIVIDRNACVAYELSQAAHCTTGWSASASAMWDLTTTEARPWTYASVDAAGLSVFEGLVRYDEIAAGVIDHAIRFTAQSTKSDGSLGYFTPPATHAAGNDPSSDNIIGMRLRLQPNFDISAFSPTNQIILKAMKQYGMILADNGPTLAFQGTPDSRWNDADLAALTAIPSTAFDVIQMGTVYESSTVPTGAAPTITSFTPSASSVLAGTSVTLTPAVTDASYSYIDQAGFNRGPITVTPTVTTTYTLTSRNAFGSASTSTTVTIQVPTIPPTLHMAAVPTQTLGVAPITVTATSNSQGAISYSIASGPAIAVGNAITLTGAGTVVVTATQAAAGIYGTGTVSVSFNINPGNPQLTFGTIPTQGFRPAPFTIPVATNSPGAILYTLVSGPATLSGNQLTFTGLGKISLRANQSATPDYLAATAITTFSVAAGVPTLTIAAIPDQTFGNPPVTLSAASTSPAPIVFSVAVGYAGVSGSTLTLLKAGAITILAKQAASGNYAAATAQTSFNVLTEPPNLKLGTIPNKTVGAAPFSVTSTSLSATVVVYTVVSGPAKISGHTVTLTGAGQVVLQGTQPASGNFSAATATTTFTVN